jgi:hypothetical protein
MVDEDEIPEYNEEWEDQDFDFILPKRGPIDKAFYPFDSSEPFKECTMCQLKFEEDTEFLVEKAVKGSDVIFELAMCIPCAEDMRKQLSVDSMKRIEAYMSSVNFEERAEHFLNNQSDQIEDFIGNCIVSGQTIKKDEEHQIYAYCVGDEMIFSALPYAISGAVMEEIQELLSPETKQELDDFMDQYLIPDDLKDLLKGRPVFV